MFAGIMLFNFPQTFIEGEFVSSLFFHLLENDVLALGGEDAVVFCMLEIDDIVLNEGVVFDLSHVQLKFPGHRVFRLFGQIHEMSHAFIGNRLGTVCLDWNDVGIVSHNWFLIQVDLYIRKSVLFIGGMVPIFSNVR